MPRAPSADPAGRSQVLRRHAAVAVLGLCFFGFAASQLDPRGMFTWDEAEYAVLGRSVLRGEGFSIGGVAKGHRLPLLPLAVATCIGITGASSDTVTKFVVLSGAVGLILVVYAGSAAALGRDTALAAAAMLGLFPLFWTYVARLMTEIPFLAFFSGALLALYGALYRDARLFSASALLAGLALSTRYTATLIGPIGALFVGFGYLSGDASVRSRLFSKQALLSPLICVGVVLPWLIRQQMQFGDALNGFRFASTQLQSYLPGVSMPWYFYLQQLPGMLSIVPTWFLLAGIAWAVYQRDRFSLHAVAVIGVFVAWFSFYRFKEARMLVPVLPFAAIVAAVGLTRGILGLVAPNWRRLGAIVAMAAVFGVNAARIRTELGSTKAIGYPSFLGAMRYLREHSAAADIIVGASYPQIAWYADRHAVDYPAETQLSAALERSRWAVVVNFERGQPKYVATLPARMTPADAAAGDIVVFADARYRTVLMRSEALRRRLAQ